MLSQHGDRAKQALMSTANWPKPFESDAAYWSKAHLPIRSELESPPKSPELFSRPNATFSCEQPFLAPTGRRGGDQSGNYDTMAPLEMRKDASSGFTSWLVHPKGSCSLLLEKSETVGRYKAEEHLLTMKGSYEAHFALDNVPITGSPVCFKVRAAKPSGKHSYIIAPDTPAVVNQPYKLTLHAVDKYGNHLDAGGARVDVKLMGATAPCTVVDHEDGTYSLHLKVSAVGSYGIEVHIDSLKVRSAPNASFFQATDTCKAESSPQKQKSKDSKAQRARTCIGNTFYNSSRQKRRPSLP